MPRAQWLDAESAWADPERGSGTEAAGAVSSPVEPALLESAWAASVWATDRPTVPVAAAGDAGQPAEGRLLQPSDRAGWPPAVWAWLARVVALGLVPAAVALRTLAAGAWWSGLGTAGSVLLAAALLLTLLGLRWTWVATSPPYALRRATARRLAEAEQRRRDQAVHAAELLSRLGEGGVDDGAAWEAFEQHSGLTVPGSTRAVIDPGMDPAALVRYLGARRRDGSPVPQPLLVVAVVPLVTTLVPAALLTLLA